MKKWICMFLISYAACCNVAGQNKKYVNAVKYFPENYTVDTNTDYTGKLQMTINAYDSIIMPNFPISINDKGLYIPSNKSIVFQPNTVLKLEPSDKAHYALISIKNSDNVRIYNPNIVGDRDNHKGNKGEWGMGIHIEGSSNIKIINANISKFWGDGIYITRNRNINSKNIIIDNSIIKNNRRNGISVISGHNVFIQNSTFINNIGTNPMAGIDIEPNTPKDSLGYIKVKNIKTLKNRVGLQVSMMKFPSSKKQTFIIDVEDMSSNEDDHGLLIRDFYRVAKYGKNAVPLDGKVNYKNITIQHSNQEPIKFFNSKKGYEYGPKYNFYNIKIEKSEKSEKWMRNERVKNELRLRGFNVKNF